MFISQDSASHTWKDFTLVVPAVSVGNVGQLSTDLLISTLWMNRVGSLYDDSILPIVGNDPFAHGHMQATCNIVTAVDVYENKDVKLVAVQQRAPFVKGRRKQFLEKLMKWITENCFREVVILASSHSHERRDVQMHGTQLRFKLSLQAEEEHGSVIRNNLKWTELENRESMPGVEASGLDSKIFLPGSGIARDLFHECCNQTLSAVILSVFCSEGDNAADATFLATCLNNWKSWCDLKKSNELSGTSVSREGWLIPSSWRLQYGSRFDQILFQ